jgi:hypothetical protein
MTLMKSEAVNRPANVEVWVFHSGAETMSTLEMPMSKSDTVLNETVEGFLDKEIGVQQNQSEADR